MRRATRFQLAAAAGIGLALAVGAAEAAAWQVPAGGTPSAPWSSPALSHMPLPSWLSLSGEVRTRMEERSGLGFQEGASDGYGLVRTRLNVDIQPHSLVRISLQGQDARAPGILASRANGVFRDPFDLRQAYLRVGRADGPVAITVGRQLLLYGDQRLIGPLDWTNTSRTFDAAKVEIRTARIDLDVFSSWVVANDPTRTVNKSDTENGLYGAYARVRSGWQPLVVEPFLLWRTKPAVGPTGDTDRFSGGARLAARGRGIESSLMWVEQWGTVGAADIRARAVSMLVAYTFAAPLSPRLLAEANYASGDGDPGDGKIGAFDDMFPTAHLYYGYNDVVGLRNTRNLRLGGSVKPWASLTVAADVHFFRLATGNDGLYNVAGVKTVSAPAGGAADLGVGQEVDVTFAWKVSETVSLAGGFGHLFPGAFLEANTAGAGDTFTHTALTVRF